MNFEHDPVKSRSNREKHGIDFKEAQELWADDKRIELPSYNQKEERFLIIGRIEFKNWTAIVTYRGDVVRIISVRRSRRQEVDLYEG